MSTVRGGCSCGGGCRTGDRCGGGCCDGIEPSTPLSTENRPGLATLTYRVGTHGSFLETMIGRLTGHQLADGRRPLRSLTTREPDDFSIALLDAWATVGDVLTFYQERIANEGYLGTATERRSVLELARLVGYELRPGVAASVHLAFTLERDQEIEIPAGTAARSVPGPGELPQIFETDEAIRARTEWGEMKPRPTRPTRFRASFSGTRDLWLKGIATDLKVNDPLLLFFGSRPVPYRVHAVEADAAAGRTRVRYAMFEGTGSAGSEAEPAPVAVETTVVATASPGGSPLSRLATVVGALRRDPSVPPASRFQLQRTPERTYNSAADLAPQLLVRFNPRIEQALYAAYRRAPAPTDVNSAGPVRLEATRVKAAVFGHNIVASSGGVGILALSSFTSSVTTNPRQIALDAVYDGILPGSWVVVHRAGNPPVVTRVTEVATRTREADSVAVRVTELLLEENPWAPDSEPSISAVRDITVHALGEPLQIAEEPIQAPIEGAEIELDRLYDGLDAGRWLVVRGERADVLDANGEPIEGIEAEELVMLAGVTHGPAAGSAGAGPGPNEAALSASVLSASGKREPVEPGPLHTRFLLSEPLAYAYRRETVTINANVARASHGETRREVLGSGDATRAFQRFTTASSPVTQLSAPTRDGVESTLEVRVEGIRWPRRETLLGAGPTDRGYITSRNDAGETSILFGDGKRGARLPTGVENVTALYRSGIGAPGNVDAKRISILATRPLGVRDVLNPLRASGGADPESRDQARRNVPLASLALDRLVSVQDYADFARTFAGVARASAVRLTDGRRQLVHLTIAGVDDGPIDPGSDLLRNLRLALTRYGDPATPVDVSSREVIFVFLSAKVSVADDRLWEDIEPALRTALLDAFGFERRELGQPLRLGEVIAVMHTVPGVEFVDVDLFEGISESEALDPEALGARLEEFAAVAAGSAASAGSGESDDDPASGSGLSAGASQVTTSSGARPRQLLPVQLARLDPAIEDPEFRIRPAQLAYLNPELPDTLILTELVS